MRFMPRAVALGARTGERMRLLKEVDSGFGPMICRKGRPPACFVSCWTRSSAPHRAFGIMMQHSRPRLWDVPLP